jgi:hypothetical protein
MNEKTRSKKLKMAIGLFLLVIAGLVVAWQWRGHVGCYLFYECGPFQSTAAMPDWKIPSNPHERKMYDLAHSVKVPDSVAKPVPFDFKAARISHLYGGKSVAQQYFEHLCATESREYIFKPQDNVDGLLIMRPRAESMDSPENRDRYGLEEPTGMGWFSDDNQLYGNARWLDRDYVQPLYGRYRYVEYIDPLKPSEVINIYRDQVKFTNSDGTPVYTNFNGFPSITSRKIVTQHQAKFGYIWRGLRRPRDRDFAIGGGDFFIIRLDTLEVLGMFRTFSSTFIPPVPSATNWAGARGCFNKRETITPAPKFVSKVLRPNLKVNDQFLEPELPSTNIKNVTEETGAKNANQ